MSNFLRLTGEVGESLVVKVPSIYSTDMTENNSCHKRTDYLNWDEYFMATAYLAAKRSKDPATQVGACIVNSEKRIVSIGYNGMPNGCSDDILPWTKEMDQDGTNKLSYVCHAEMNAIASGNFIQKDCVLYTTLFPCNECAKLIIQSGIKEIVYHRIKNETKPKMIASKRMLDLVGIKQRLFIPSREEIVIDFGEFVGEKKA